MKINYLISTMDSRYRYTKNWVYAKKAYCRILIQNFTLLSILLR